MNVAIYIYDQAEVLDFSGPFEVFSTAARVMGDPDAFNVFLISQYERPVVARGGFNVLPKFSFTHHPAIDVLIVVGGVHHDEMNKSEVLDWLSQQAKDAKVVASVCTGAFLLAQCGLLTTQDVTTHWEDLGDLKRQFPTLNVIENVRWVEQGKYLTSGGISAGIDMSLHIVGRLKGKAVATATARQMEFTWTQV
ncbi:DJ-1/PfpI family protein [Alteromonas sp. D210916BOD_24]|uniref:DJ-1/PfpI family protein n=1 Tax=Alteromonas sp. D210916BOD_24 TaxID=3157618 RepID=UPI00399D45B3